jgi:glucose-1-phosphate thymidylyltransferase
MAEDGFITRAVEKPEIPKSNLALVGIYKILESEKLIKALDTIIQKGIKNRDQYYITDAIMMMLEDGVKMKAFNVDKWYDCGKKEILLETNAMLLSKLKGKKHHRFENTIIIEPVSIPDNCNIQNSIIGPNVSIGENSTIKYSIITDSIIGAFSTLDSIVLNNSLIGSDATLKGMNQSLNLGDSTEITFS